MKTTEGNFCHTNNDFYVVFGCGRIFKYKENKQDIPLATTLNKRAVTKRRLQIIPIDVYRIIINSEQGAFTRLFTTFLRDYSQRQL